MEIHPAEFHLTLTTIIICVVMNLLGQGAHLMFVTVPAMRQQMAALNKKFTYGEWWSCDSNLIIGVQMLSLALLIGIAEIIHWKPIVLEYIRWFFFIFGTIGSLIGMRWSQYQKMVIGFVDINANISKAVVGSDTKTVKELTEKASAALNVDVSTTPPDAPKP